MTRVLFFNQTGQASGAERSLLELLRVLPPDIEAALACPPGQLAEEASALGVPVHDAPATDLSFRPHPVHTPVGLAWIGRAAWRVRGIARRLGSDIVHANTTRAGLAAAGAHVLGGPPVVVHVRDWVPDGRAPAAVLGLVERGSAAVIANSEFTAGQLPRAGSTPVEVVPNPVDSRRFDPKANGRAPARAALGLGDEDEVLAVVAQLTPWKGQDDAIRMLAALADERPRARLLVAGSAKFSAASTRFDNTGYADGLRSLAAEVGVADRVSFLGERSDVPAILAAADVALVPSWREAFGRSALEAMAMAVPVVVTSVGGPAEIVRDGVEGRVLPPHEPDLWAQVVGDLLADPADRARLGEAGARRAREAFSPESHAGRVGEIYADVLRRRG
jgi:glycosyltransferase involved in cell wall biosynthesis